MSGGACSVARGTRPIDSAHRRLAQAPPQRTTAWAPGRLICGAELTTPGCAFSGRGGQGFITACGLDQRGVFPEGELRDAGEAASRRALYLRALAMRKMQTRRMFLDRSAAATAALVCGAAGTRAAAPASGFRYAICNETFPDWPLDKVCRFAAGCGYGGVEIAPFTLGASVAAISKADRARLRREAEAAGVQLVGLHWLLARTEGLHLTSPDPDVRRRTADYLGALAEFCAELGGAVMVFGSPKQRSLLPGVSREQAMEHAADVLRRAAPVFERFGVVLALEPLSAKTTTFMTTAAEAVELADRVGSPRCRLLLDCLAMSSESAPIPDLICAHGSRLAHFHANDPNSLGPGMGTLDFGPILGALREVDYRGWISVEVFAAGPGPEELTRRSIEYLKRVEAGLAGAGRR